MRHGSSDVWQAAWAERARLAEAAPWGLPPRVPVEDIADIRFAQSGRFAIIVGYAGVHHLDLDTLRARCIFADARTERTVAISDDGTQAAVFDQYGPCLHLLDLVAGTSKTIQGSSGQLRKRMRTVGPRSRAVCPGVVRTKNRVRLTTPTGDVELLPLVGKFGRVLDITRCADGRVIVAADGRTDPRAEDRARCLFVFDPGGGALGTIRLAQRGRGAALVFMNGQAMTVEALAAAGVTVTHSASGEAKGAMARFQPAHPDGADEVVLGRSATGFLGRLDADAPLGTRAYGFEDVERTRRALLGQPPLDDLVQAQADDAALRFHFWAARLSDARTFEIAHQISARFTPFLPWIAQRVLKPGAKGGRKGLRKRLEHARSAVRRMGADEAQATFDAMCARMHFEARAAVLAGLLDRKPAGVVNIADGDLSAVEHIIAVANDGGHLDLTAAPGLLGGWAIEGLSGLTSVALPAGKAGAVCMQALLRTGAPTLTALDIRRGHLSDGTAFALAAHRGFPALITLHLPPKASPQAKAALHLSPRLPATLPGDHTEGVARMLTDRRLEATLRLQILAALSPDAGQVGLHLVAETMPGVHLTALLDALTASLDTPIVLEGFELAAADVTRTPPGSVARRCTVDLQAALVIAHAARRGQPALALEDCVLSPAAQAAMHLERGDPGPPTPTGLAALLCTRAVPDGRWFAVINRGRARHRAAFDAAFAGLSGEALGALIDARPGVVLWALQRAEMAVCQAIARRLRAAGQADTLIKPLALHWLPASGWQIQAIKRPIPFTCEPEAAFSAVGKFFGQQDVLTGDAAFDARAHLSGSPADVLERFDAPRRTQWMAAFTMGVRLQSHALTGPSPLPPPEVLAHLLVTVVGGPLDEPASVRMIRRFETEPEGGVRARLLRCVFEMPDLTVPARDALCAQALVDPAVGVRDIAAEMVWPAVAAADDLTVFDGATLAAVLDRITGDRQLAAIAHIGAVGDEACVGALVEAGSGLFKGRKLRDATQAAVAEITKRIGGLRTGGLSVAQVDHGGLSTPEE